MSSIQIIERSEGLPRQEVAARLSIGWLCIANIAVPQTIAVPGQPEAGKSIDVWLAPPYGAMMPQLAVVQALLMAEDSGSDIITLDDLSKVWFNQPLRQLREQLTQKPEEPEGEPQKKSDA